jgi:hypothetical protein
MNESDKSRRGLNGWSPRHRLNAAQVAELAELLEDSPRRAGVVEEVLQAAAEGRGTTLLLADPGHRAARPALGPAARGVAELEVESGRHR